MAGYVRQSIEVEVGSIWASTHKGDVLHGERQRRLVTDVSDDYVWFLAKSGKGSYRVKRMPNGTPRGHRFVESPRGSEPKDALASDYDRLLSACKEEVERLREDARDEGCTVGRCRDDGEYELALLATERALTLRDSADRLQAVIQSCLEEGR